MALPASGAISLSQVNTELSLSSTATISMNDAAVRSLFGVPSGAISMSNGYGKSAYYAWIGSWNNSNYPNIYAVEQASNGDIYMVGTETADPSFVVSPFLAKLNSSGVLQWKRSISLDSSSGGYANEVKIGSDGFIYIAGRSRMATYTYEHTYVAKFDSSGTMQWIRACYPADNATTGNCYAGGLALDSANSVYVVEYSTNSFVYLTKFNSSGTFQWGKRCGSGLEARPSVSIDTSDNVFVSFQTSSAGYGNSDTILVKMDTAGTVAWQQRYGTSRTEQSQQLGLDTDGSGNVYIIENQIGLTTDTPASTVSGCLLKVNSAGTVQWKVNVPSLTTSAYNGVFFYGVSVDRTNGFVYVSGSDNNAKMGLLLKYDLSGNLQWQRRIYNSTMSFTGADVCARYDLVTFQSSIVNFEGGLLHAPKDGSKTGSWTINTKSITYDGSTGLTSSAVTTSSGTGTVAVSGFYPNIATPSGAAYDPNMAGAAYNVTSM